MRKRRTGIFCAGSGFVQHVLYQYVDIFGICGDVSQCSGAADVYPAYQGEVAWHRVCGAARCAVYTERIYREDNNRRVPA